MLTKIIKEATQKRVASLCQLLLFVRRPRCALLTQTQSLNDSTVASDIALLQVVEEGTTLTYEASQSALGAVVLAVLLHVLGEVLDAESEQCDLALSATSVCSTLTIGGEELGLLL